MRLEISQEAFEKFREVAGIFGLSDDALLRQLLKMQDQRPVEGLNVQKNSPMVGHANGLIIRGGKELKVGKNIFADYKGRRYRAEVVEGGVRKEGENKIFGSLTDLARSVTHNNVNGQQFWKEMGGDGRLRPIQELS